MKASGGNTKRAIQFTSIMPGKKPKSAHSLIWNLKNRMANTENIPPLKLIHFWPVDEWKHPAPSPEQHELRSPRVTSGARADSPSPMLTLTGFPNDTQQLAFNFVIKKPGREAEWVRHDPKQNLTPETMPNSHRLCLSSGLKCLVSNNNETTYHWTLLRKTYFNRRETHFIINQPSREFLIFNSTKSLIGF